MIITLFAVLAGLVYSCERNTDAVIEIDTGLSDSEGIQQMPENISTDGVNNIYVHITGYVNAPGVYMLPEGSRVFEAIRQAGGLLPDASEEYLNLAAVLTDGQKIVVLSKEEAETAEAFMGEAGMTGSDVGKLVNINTATVQELTTLTGIGESRALAIIAYREEHGFFQSIDGIKKVTGIKDGLFEKIKNQITI